MTESGKDGRAETISGQAIALVHDLWSPDISLTEEERARRGAKHDFLAEVSADLVAFLPYKLSPALSGIIRASMLVKPGSSLSDNLSEFGVNAAEGAALRFAFSRLTRSVSMFPHKEAASSLVRADSTMFLQQGASFAAIKSGFDSKSWQDQNGELSIFFGVENIGKSAAIGGLIAVPLGRMGTSITSLVSERALRAGFGYRTAFGASGLVSGYGTGAFVGGTTAWLDGKEPLEVLSLANESGLIGTFSTSALMLSGGLKPEILAAVIERRLAKVAPQSQSSAAGREVNLDSAKLPELDVLTVKALSLSRGQDLSRDELLSQSASFSPEFFQVRVLKEPRTLSEVPVISGDLALRRTSVQETWPVRLYDQRIGGGSVFPLRVPESYARALDAAALNGGMLKTGQNSYGFPAHHIEIRNLLATTPDQNLIKSVIVRPDDSPNLAWYRRTMRDPFAKILASTVVDEGSISFFAASRGKSAQRSVDHEWAHLLEPKVPDLFQRFSRAARMEAQGYYLSAYSKTHLKENWADHVSAYTGSVNGFVEFVHRAPLRAVIIAEAVQRAAQSQAGIKGTAPDRGLEARWQYVQEKIAPQAVNIATRLLGSPRKDLAADAALFLAESGSSKEIAKLRLGGLSSVDEHIRLASLRGLFDDIVRQDYRLKGYDWLKGKSDGVELSRLLRENLSAQSANRSIMLKGLGAHYRPALPAAVSHFEGQHIRVSD